MSFADGESHVTRKVFHASFREARTTSGTLAAHYFPSDDRTPLFTVARCPGGWFIASMGGTKNHVLLDNVHITDPVKIIEGAKLEIFSVVEGRPVIALNFRCGKE